MALKMYMSVVKPHCLIHFTFCTAVFIVDTRIECNCNDILNLMLYTFRANYT